jgi:small subunit ribosomal protein S6
MAKAPLIYDLMVLLDSSLEDDRRAKILADVEQTIAGAGGTVELKQRWGLRKLAFEIAHTADADYHLLQFSGPPTLVETLSYNLKIADGVLRHRIIKVTPGTPPPPEPTAPSSEAPAPAEQAEAAEEPVEAGAAS